MPFINPVVLCERNVRLEPLTLAHEENLKAAAADGKLWQLRVTSVPKPDETRAYIEKALKDRETGYRFPFVVWDEAAQKIVGCTSFHDIVPAIKRVEIGFTWYAKSAQRSHINSVCKLLLLRHAFEDLGCAVVGFRTDNFNFASQRAIERLGAKKDGVIRHHLQRQDGTVRDTVIYSLTSGEWQECKAQLIYRLDSFESMD